MSKAKTKADELAKANELGKANEKEHEKGHEKTPVITLVKVPSFTRLLLGGIAAYSLSMVMNPAFGVIAFLLILLIPLLTIDSIFSRQFHKAYHKPVQIKKREMSRSQYLEYRLAVAAEAARVAEVERLAEIARLAEIEKKLKAKAKGK